MMGAKDWTKKEFKDLKSGFKKGTVPGGLFFKNRLKSMAKPFDPNKWLDTGLINARKRGTKVFDP